MATLSSRVSHVWNTKVLPCITHPFFKLGFGVAGAAITFAIIKHFSTTTNPIILDKHILDCQLLDTCNTDLAETRQSIYEWQQDKIDPEEVTPQNYFAKDLNLRLQCLASASEICKVITVQQAGSEEKQVSVHCPINKIFYEGTGIPNRNNSLPLDGPGKLLNDNCQYDGRFKNQQFVEGVKTCTYYKEKIYYNRDIVIENGRFNENGRLEGNGTQTQISRHDNSPEEIITTFKNFQFIDGKKFGKGELCWGKLGTYCDPVDYQNDNLVTN